MLSIRPALKRYQWGTPHDLPELLGIEPDGGPYAEAWWGAHPGGSATVETNEGSRTLEEVIADDPAAALGARVLASHGDRLPYLLKVLAIGRPLSIQVHPGIEAAREGFVSEERAGIPRDAPERVYRDANHKPEMVVALTPMVLLLGFRPSSEVREDLAAIGGPVAARLIALCRDDDPDGFTAYLTGVMTDKEAPGLVSDLAFAGAHRGAGANLAAAARAASHFPGDPGALVALAMNLVRLEPGESGFIADGVIHSYLSGVGLEIMANSDNVIRAGLTPKHIDVATWFKVSRMSACEPERPGQTRQGTATWYTPPVNEFSLAVIDGGEARFEPGPRMVVCLDDGAFVRSAEGEVRLQRGEAVFVLDADGPLAVESAGRTAVAIVP